MKTTYTTGDEYRLDLRFTQDDVILFAKVTGDNNPIHLDDAVAAKTIFRKKVIHGFLAASSFSRVLGTLFPGEGTIYLSQTLNFDKPMYIDTNYTAHFRIVSIEKSKATIQTQILNEQGVVTISGEAIIYNKKLQEKG